MRGRVMCWLAGHPGWVEVQVRRRIGGRVFHEWSEPRCSRCGIGVFRAVGWK